MIIKSENMKLGSMGSGRESPYSLLGKDPIEKKHKTAYSCKVKNYCRVGISNFESKFIVNSSADMSQAGTCLDLLSTF